MTRESLEVVVTDVGKDAALYGGPGGAQVLYVRPGQTFESAVQAVQAVLGHGRDDVARQLVTKHLPGLIRLDVLLAPPEPVSCGHWRSAVSAVSLVTIGLVVLVLLVAWAFMSVDIRGAVAGG